MMLTDQQTLSTCSRWG